MLQVRHVAGPCTAHNSYKPCRILSGQAGPVRVVVRIVVKIPVALVLNRSHSITPPDPEEGDVAPSPQETYRVLPLIRLSTDLGSQYIYWGTSAFSSRPPNPFTSLFVTAIRDHTTGTDAGNRNSEPWFAHGSIYENHADPCRNILFLLLTW
jgi:hypothetical protein